MKSLYRALATSDHPAARLVRRSRRAVHDLSLPGPPALFRPLLWIVLAIRNGYHFLARVLYAEPLFKAYCTRIGKDVHTGIFLHWVIGKGEIILGDRVKFWGKSTVAFAARFVDAPRLIVGDESSIGHDVILTIGKEIRIGRYCHIAGGTRIFDSGGHPLDPTRRIANQPLDPDEVKPVVIGDNVWIGQNCTIFPGVTIGDNSVVSTASVVTSDVPPNTLVAGYPARRIRALDPLRPGAAWNVYPPEPPLTTERVEMTING